MRMRKLAAWHRFGLGALAVTVAFALLRAHPLAQALLFVGLQAAATVAILRVVRRHTPQRRRPWTLLLAAESTYLVANLWWYLYPTEFGGTLSYPSPVDVLFWAAYAGWAVFLAVLIRKHGGADAGASLDAVVISGGLAVLAWEFLLEPALRVPGVAPTARLASIVYPVLLLVLASLAMRLVMVSGVRTGAHALVLVSIVAELTADVWYSIASARGSFSYGSHWFIAWIVAYAALGCAALHPDVGALTTAAGPRKAHPTQRLVSLWLAVVAPLLVLMRNVAEGDDVTEVTVLLVVVALIVGLVLVRLRGLLVDLDEEQRTRELLKRQAVELERLAFRDPLTGLANRALLYDRLTHALAARPSSDDESPAVLLLDLDRFKAVNDTRGHDVGDVVLVEVAKRLVTAVRPRDTVARVGGDEFVVLLEAVTVPEAAVVAERIRQALREPVRVADQDVVVSASIGLVSAEPGDCAADTLQRADLAMYSAKEYHPGQVEIFVHKLHHHLVERYELENDLKTALRHGQLVLHYQPVVELSTGTMVGVEALVRWDHPTRGLLSPDQFIPIAEQSGAVGELGLWVLAEACAQVLRWDACKGGGGLHVAVNLSPRQLHDPSLVSDVRACLRGARIDPARVTLEVTEGALLEDAEETMAQLHNLTSLGVTLAIDDFGTGYSSLSYLRRLPADILKIDRAFVTGIAREPQEWAVASAIVRLAGSVGKQTLAEGVERPDQLAHLLALGCRFGQGYLFSRPLPADGIQALFDTPRLPSTASAGNEPTVIDAPFATERNRRLG